LDSPLTCSPPCTRVCKIEPIGATVHQSLALVANQL